jgi:mono/diheme cytochrome c family protein
MKKSFRSNIVLAATVLLAGSMCFAQDGAATYKAKCAMCHGATGTPSAGMAKAMGIKPVSDPSMQALTVSSDCRDSEERQRQDEAHCRTDRSAGEAVAAYFKTLK